MIQLTQWQRTKRLRTSKNKCVSKQFMSQKIKCKQVDCHLNPKRVESTGGNARGNKQESEWLRVEKLTGCQVGMTFTAESQPKKLRRKSVYHILQTLHLCKTLYGRTQRHTRYGHRLFLLWLSWFFS